MSRRRRRALHELPVRTSRYGERCLVCLERIEMGQRYLDGGHGRRVHPDCSIAVFRGLRREPAPSEMRELERAEVDVSRAKGKVYVATDASSREDAAYGLVRAQDRVGDIKRLWAQPEDEQ